MANLISERKILFIVEGENDEPRFIRRLLDVSQEPRPFEIYTYKTNIHILAQELYNNYPDFDEDSINIQLVLSSIEPDNKKKKKLLEKYNDIFLVFDMEPQERHPHFDTVRRMLSYFCDSTNQGKLFLNYPMMQSYKDLPRLPYPDFKNTIVSMGSVNTYKKDVGNRSFCTDLSKYDRNIFYSLAAHHVAKMMYILEGVFRLPSVDEYLGINPVQILDEQITTIMIKDYVYVLNTSIFILIDFAPRRFFADIQDPKNNYSFSMN